MTEPLAPYNTADVPDDSGNTLIVQLKSAFIRALRKGFNNYHENHLMKNININMEFPNKPEDYPGVWVTFSLKDIQRFGIMSDFRDENGKLFQEIMFNGRIGVNVFALTSKERDQIASEIIQLFLFSKVSKAGKRFRKSITDEPYINMSFDEDRVDSGGQSVGQGLPWNPLAYIYEDNYAFNVMGQIRSEIEDTVEQPLAEIVYGGFMIDPEDNTDHFPDDNNGQWM